IDFPVAVDHWQLVGLNRSRPDPKGIRPSTAHRPCAGCGLAHVIFPNPVRSEPRQRRRGAAGCVGHDDLQPPAENRGDVNMPYQIAPLFCRPWTLLGIERKLIESHYENNYGGAFARLNAISAELEALDPTTAPPHVIRRLKQDEAAMLNSLALHEL